MVIAVKSPVTKTVSLIYYTQLLKANKIIHVEFKC